MAKAKGHSLNERTLIANVFAPLVTNTPGAFNLTDDAATLTPPPGKDLVITTDAIVAGVHFLPDDPPATIARKALRVNLSDLAAKGAEPLAYTMALAVSEQTSSQWLEAFAHALQADQAAYKICLLGGDTVKTPGPLSVSITAIGTTAQGGMVKRSGAKPGDRIYVSGTIGDAALGVLAAKNDKRIVPANMGEKQKQYLIDRYQLPQPRCALAPALAKFATSAMDVSDGLIGDLSALISVAKVGADIHVAQIPLSDAVQALVKDNLELREIALTGGDDYEIICTIARESVVKFETEAQDGDVVVNCIGVITEGEPMVRVLDDTGQKITFSSDRYEH